MDANGTLLEVWKRSASVSVPGSVDTPWEVPMLRLQKASQNIYESPNLRSKSPPKSGFSLFVWVFEGGSAPGALKMEANCTGLRNVIESLRKRFGPEVFFLVSNHLQASSLASQERPKLPVTSDMFFSILESLSGRD